jgi:hypothetical protein
MYPLAQPMYSLRELKDQNTNLGSGVNTKNAFYPQQYRYRK